MTKAPTIIFCGHIGLSCGDVSEHTLDGTLYIGVQQFGLVCWVLSDSGGGFLPKRERKKRERRKKEEFTDICVSLQVVAFVDKYR